MLSCVALTPLQQRFCEEYLVDLNATQAAIRAGYAQKYANRQASENLSKVDIQEEIARLKAERSRVVGLTAADVLRELKRLAFADLRKLYNPDGTLKPPHEWDDDTAAAVAGMDVEEQAGGAVVGPSGIAPAPVYVKKVKLWDKGRAIGQAMEHLGISNKLTLETVLELLGPELAGLLRQALSRRVSGGRGGAGGGQQSDG